MLFIIILIMVFFLFFLQTNKQPQLWEIENKIKSKEECDKLGGDWNKVGLGQFNLCRIPAKDQGKYCTDGSQCKHKICVNYNVGITNPKKGECPKYTSLIGNCHHIIKNGKSKTIICID
jgi:hypothetical protein